MACDQARRLQASRACSSTASCLWPAQPQAHPATVSIEYGAPSFVFHVYVHFHALLCELRFLAMLNDRRVLAAVGLLHAH